MPPLDGNSWVEHELTKVGWPINSQPVDLDKDGDLDIIGGSVAETRIILFENVGAKAPEMFRERPIKINGTSLTGATVLSNAGTTASHWSADSTWSSSI